MASRAPAAAAASVFSGAGPNTTQGKNKWYDGPQGPIGYWYVHYLPDRTPVAMVNTDGGEQVLYTDESKPVHGAQLADFLNDMHAGAATPKGIADVGIRYDQAERRWTARPPDLTRRSRNGLGPGAPT